MLLALAAFLAACFLCFPSAHAALIFKNDTAPTLDGWVSFDGAAYASDNTAATLRTYQSGGFVYRSYIKWSTATIPDNSTILGVRLNLYTVAGTNNHNIWSMAGDPSIQSNAQNYADCANGHIYGSYISAATTQQHVTLSAQAASDLQALLASDYFAVGIPNSGSTDTIKSSEGAGATIKQSPTLIVYYSYKGIYYTFSSKWENGTDNYPLTVTVTSPDGVTTIDLSASAAYGFTLRPALITWQTGAYLRQITPISDTGAFTLLTPVSTATPYYVTLYDITGQLNNGGWMETYRYVGPTLTLVERETLTSNLANNPVILGLNEYYKVQVITNGIPPVTINLGNVVALTSPNFYFYVTNMQFDQKIQTTENYVRIQAIRSPATTVNVLYNDTRSDTTFVEVTFKYWNGTIAYYANSTGAPDPSNIIFNWAAANNVTDYLLFVSATGGYFGTYEGVFEVMHPVAFASPFDLTFFGFSAATQGYVIPLALILATAAVFSPASLALGAVATSATAALLYAFGWLNQSPLILAFAFGLSIILALTELRRGRS